MHLYSASQRFADHLKTPADFNPGNKAEKHFRLQTIIPNDWMEIKDFSRLTYQKHLLVKLYGGTILCFQVFNELCYYMPEVYDDITAFALENEFDSERLTFLLSSLARVNYTPARWVLLSCSFQKVLGSWTSKWYIKQELVYTQLSLSARKVLELCFIHQPEPWFK